MTRSSRSSARRFAGAPSARIDARAIAGWAKRHQCGLVENDIAAGVPEGDTLSWLMLPRFRLMAADKAGQDVLWGTIKNGADHWTVGK